MINRYKPKAKFQTRLKVHYWSNWDKLISIGLNYKLQGSKEALTKYVQIIKPYEL